VGGQQALAAGAPGSSAIAEGFLANHARTLDAAELRLGAEATVEMVVSHDPEAVIVATGARPYEPPLSLDGVPTVQAWEVLATHPAAPGHAIVADWGGDPAGLAAAEVLAAAGARVTLCVASVAFGESLHQYRRNLALQRLYRSGVELLMHRELARADASGVVLRNTFAPELEIVLQADLVVVALGRVPVDDLAPELRGAGLRVEEAGDCLSPRGLEEAVLEGSLAAQRVFA
jgi:pyruvate/2-oxoglutarate dehydrogenase complex dihydrolipoamide dehydrogenase (E3) component